MKGEPEQQQRTRFVPSKVHLEQSYIKGLMRQLLTSATTLRAPVHEEMCRMGRKPGDTQAPGTEGGMWRKLVELIACCLEPLM